ncbi:MAG: alpha-N-arabinofuranosidase [Turicibacter sp.]|nr:alpha-N-arabinofuranosidase [Turicibacter sp.]
MADVKIYVEKHFKHADIDDKLYSSFIEHLGRAVYTGIYEPDHPTADEQGFRQDVIDMVKELDVKLVRYPGGNFLSGYNWLDGVGPKENRPVRLDLAWKSIEPNEVGIDEFVDWCKKSGTEIMGAVNMGTGTPQDAAYLVEYCNFPGGTYYSDLRQKNGHQEPHGIKTWCIGNEMDGPWQTCHLSAEDYGKKALETAKMMKWVDDSIELVVCGSATSLMPTYPEWDRIVLEHTYELVDYLSLHRYYENEGNDMDFLSSFYDMDDFIKSVCATADYVKALKRSDKTMYLSFDEWNVWYQQKQTRENWKVAPEILEDRYSLLDALVFGGMGLTLLNNADRVKVACLAQLVNVIAPIFTKKGGPVIKQSIFYPFQDLSKYGRGEVLKPVVLSPTTKTRYGQVPIVHQSVVHHQAKREVTVFALNINEHEATSLNLDFNSFGELTMVEHKVMAGEDLHAINTFEQPENVVPFTIDVVEGASQSFELTLPKLSWNVIRFTY